MVVVSAASTTTPKYLTTEEAQRRYDELIKLAARIEDAATEGCFKNHNLTPEQHEQAKKYFEAGIPQQWREEAKALSDEHELGGFYKKMIVMGLAASNIFSVDNGIFLGTGVASYALSGPLLAITNLGILFFETRTKFFETRIVFLGARTKASMSSFTQMMARHRTVLEQYVFPYNKRERNTVAIGHTPISRSQLDNSVASLQNNAVLNSLALMLQGRLGLLEHVLQDKEYDLIVKYEQKQIMQEPILNTYYSEFIKIMTLTVAICEIMADPRTGNCMERTLTNDTQDWKRIAASVIDALRIKLTIPIVGESLQIAQNIYTMVETQRKKITAQKLLHYLHPAENKPKLVEILARKLTISQADHLRNLAQAPVSRGPWWRKLDNPAELQEKCLRQAAKKHCGYLQDIMVAYKGESKTIQNFPEIFREFVSKIYEKENRAGSDQYESLFNKRIKEGFLSGDVGSASNSSTQEFQQTITTFLEIKLAELEKELQNKPDHAQVKKEVQDLRGQITALQSKIKAPLAGGVQQQLQISETTPNDSSKAQVQANTANLRELANRINNLLVSNIVVNENLTEIKEDVGELKERTHLQGRDIRHIQREVNNLKRNAFFVGLAVIIMTLFKDVIIAKIAALSGDAEN